MKLESAFQRGFEATPTRRQHETIQQEASFVDAVNSIVGVPQAQFRAHILRLNLGERADKYELYTGFVYRGTIPLTSTRPI